MVAVTVGLFRGMAEKISPRLLPEDMAVSIVNADLDAGTLRPIKAMASASITIAGGTSTAAPTSSSKLLFQARDGSWFNYINFDSWTAIDSPIAEDAHNRVYANGYNSTSSFVLVSTTTAPTTAFFLGLPVAATPSQTISPINSAETETETAVSRAYVVTHYTAFGEEGPPSVPTAILDVRSDQTVALTLAASSAAQRNIVYHRIYRTDASGSFRFVAQVSATTSAAFTDTVLDAALGEVLISQDWNAPPVGMSGLCSMSNGICAGFKEQTVCFSEAFLPHAWPKRYQLTTQYNITAIKPLETGLLVMTEGKPYIVQGADPAGMVMTELNVPYPISSATSAVDMGGSVIYCSTEGLVRVSSSGAALATESLFSSEGWLAAHSPASVTAFLWEGKYVAFHDAVDGVTGFIFDPRGGKAAFTKHTAGEVNSGFSSTKDDALYVVSGGSVKKFAASTDYLEAEWVSRHYYSARPINLGAARVAFGDNLGAGNTVVKLLSSDALDEPSLSDITHTETIPDTVNEITFRLPSGYKDHCFGSKVTTKREIHSISFAECPAEIR